MIFKTLSKDMERRRDGQIKKSIFEIFLCGSNRNCHHTQTQIKRATLKIFYVRFEIDKLQRYVHHFIYLLNYSNKKVFKA
jgi:hypothetical protein